MMSVERCYYFLIIGERNGARRASVKGFFEGQYAVASRLERGQFYGVFVGLGPGVT